MRDFNKRPLEPMDYFNAFAVTPLVIWVTFNPPEREILLTNIIGYSAMWFILGSHIHSLTKTYKTAYVKVRARVKRDK